MIPATKHHIRVRPGERPTIDQIMRMCEGYRDEKIQDMLRLARTKLATDYADLDPDVADRIVSEIAAEYEAAAPQWRAELRERILATVGAYLGER